TDAPAADYIIPGLVDLQVNGSHGIDAMRASSDGLRALSRALAREGVAAWLPTAVTSPLDRIERTDGAIAEARDSQSGNADQAAILGMHLEGPFISPARLGAHPKLNVDPSGDALARVLTLRTLKLITLAPELPGALDAIGRLVARGVVVSIGHTDSTMDEARTAIASGARMFTHLFNAMRPLNQRDPGVIAAALSPSPAFAAVIPDGVHVHCEVLRMALLLRGAAGIILVTDKVALAHASKEVAERAAARGVAVRNGVARLDNGTIAGAVISLLDGVRIMVDQVGASVGESAMMAATNPALLLGISDRGRLEVGARADMLVLDDKLQLKAVFISGCEIS
ncbi:MAG: N-acetylglucosamine-6-phosphate deacetylase, partial [Candidatus Binataceae bacterium]